MALRAAVMNPADISTPTRRPRHLLRKQVLLLLLIEAYALGLVLLFDYATWFPLPLFSFFADSTLGVVAGFGSRWLLARRHWAIRFITTTILSVAGLSVLGYFSKWKIGIDLLALSRGNVGMQEMIHIIVGITASWAALWAWYRPAPDDVEPTDVGEPGPAAVVVEPRRISQPRSWLPRSRLGSRSSLDSHPGNGSSPAVRSKLKLVTRQPARSKRLMGPRVRRPQVHLALVEEHRCPYCLELVERSDPRGVKECEVCHSLHHADCWAITGTCQVPHLNT